MFRGNEVELALAPNPYGGIVEARIDNGAWREVHLRATDPNAEHRVSIAKNLLPGEHPAEVRVKQGELWLDGIVVKSSNNWRLEIAAWVALGIALLCALAWATVFFVRRGRSQMRLKGPM
jgi:hypothetical protein